MATHDYCICAIVIISFVLYVKNVYFPHEAYKRALKNGNGGVE
jgi:hypothetical protein